MRLTRLLTLGALALTVGLGAAQGPVKSGLPVGLRPGPYAALVCTGENRGQHHCFVCETADRPAVIVFARALSEPLGKLTKGLDEALAAHKKAELRGWVTFLAESHTALDPKVVEWGRKHAVSTVPLMVFEDPVGPPSYRLSKEAEVTVLLSIKQKVVANFAFRAGELNDQGVAAVLKALPQIVE